MVPEQLVGTWSLQLWERQRADGAIDYPVGRDATGYLTYTSDGYVFVMVMRPGRPHFTTDSLVGGTDEERARAASTFWSYCGRYAAGDGRVIHYVELSSFPNWSGTVQQRAFNVCGDVLTLTVSQGLPAGTTTSRLVWHRTAQ
jgi:hypothetical protein